MIYDFIYVNPLSKSLCAFACFAAIRIRGPFPFRSSYLSAATAAAPPSPRNAETAENVHVGGAGADL